MDQRLGDVVRIRWEENAHHGALALLQACHPDGRCLVQLMGGKPLVVQERHLRASRSISPCLGTKHC